MTSTLKDFHPGQRVAYVPLHARRSNEDEPFNPGYKEPSQCLAHPDVEWGIVYRLGEKAVFVKFDASVRNCGWEHATAQGCDPGDLVPTEWEE